MNDFQSVEVIENGPVRYSIKVYRNFCKSNKEADTQIMVYNLNVPMHAVVEEAQLGSLKNEMSLLKLDKDNCIVEVVKKAKDSEGIRVILKLSSRKYFISIKYY